MDTSERLYPLFYTLILLLTIAKYGKGKGENIQILFQNRKIFIKQLIWTNFLHDCTFQATCIQIFSDRPPAQLPLYAWGIWFIISLIGLLGSLILQLGIILSISLDLETKHRGTIALKREQKNNQWIDFIQWCFITLICYFYQSNSSLD